MASLPSYDGAFGLLVTNGQAEFGDVEARAEQQAAFRLFGPSAPSRV